MKKEWPFFSVIVPTYGRPNQLEVCLRSLSVLDYPPKYFEVIVVDDGSPISLEPVVESVENQLSMTLIKQPNAGPASARNSGAIHAKGEFLAFIDDDCMASSNWLRELSDALAENPNRLVGGRTINAIPENIYSTGSQLLISYLYTYYNHKLDEAYFFASNNMALSAALFQKIGGFDAITLRATAEDRELCDRWLYHGYRMTYMPSAIVYHAHALTLRSFWRQHFNYGRGAFYFHRLRASRSQESIKVEPLSFYINLLRYPFSELRGWRGLSIAALLVISQIANTAGFFWEAGHYCIRSTRNTM